MLPRSNPTATKQWQELQQHFLEMKNVQMRELFLGNPDRFTQFSINAKEILFDYSKNIISDKTIRLLLNLADECRLSTSIEAMFNGNKINEMENRPVLHTALRNFSGLPAYAEGTDVMPAVKKVQKQMKNFCNRIHSGKWRGYTGKRIRYKIGRAHV